MKPQIAALCLITIVTLLVLSTVSDFAQTTRRKPSVHASQAVVRPAAPKFGYVTKALFLPSPAMGGPVLPPVPPPSAYDFPERTLSYVNPVFVGNVNFVSGAINDKGNAAFAVEWDMVGSTYRQGGVYTEHRKVVSIGEVIDGQKISGVSNVQINNSGVVSYLADVYQSSSNQPVQEVFVERNLALKQNPWFDNNRYILGEDGKAYNFSAPALDTAPISPGYVTTDGVTIYQLPGMPPDPRGKNYPVIELPPDVAQRIVSEATLTIPEISFQDHVNDYTYYRADGTVAFTVRAAGPLWTQANALFPQPYPWSGSQSAGGPIGAEVSDLIGQTTPNRQIWLNSQGQPIMASTVNPDKLSGVAGLIEQRGDYAAGGFGWPEEVANGLAFSGYEGKPLGSPIAMNRAGQILLSVLPLPDTHQIFGYAIATPGTQPTLLFSDVLTDGFKADVKNAR